MNWKCKMYRLCTHIINAMLLDPFNNKGNVKLLYDYRHFAIYKMVYIIIIGSTKTFLTSSNSGTCSYGRLMISMQYHWYLNNYVMNERNAIIVITKIQYIVHAYPNSWRLLLSNPAKVYTIAIRYMFLFAFLSCIETFVKCMKSEANGQRVHIMVKNYLH